MSDTFSNSAGQINALWRYVTSAATVNITNQNSFTAFMVSGTTTVNLPSSPPEGFTCIVKNIGNIVTSSATLVTLSAGSNTINGTINSALLAPGDWVQVIWDGTAIWRVVNKYFEPQSYLVIGSGNGSEVMSSGFYQNIASSYSRNPLGWGQSNMGLNVTIPCIMNLQYASYVQSPITAAVIMASGTTITIGGDIFGDSRSSAAQYQNYCGSAPKVFTLANSLTTSCRVGYFNSGSSQNLLVSTFTATLIGRTDL